MASKSSLDAKNGNIPLKILKKITPQLQISMAKFLSFDKLPLVWSVTLNKTSGALNPLVPARLARMAGLDLIFKESTWDH